MTEKQINSFKGLSFLGLMGLSGFTYFINYDLQQLFFLSYLAFFAYIPMYKELKKGTDERTKENIAKSNRIVAIIAICTLLLIGIIPTLLHRELNIQYSPVIYIGLASIGFFCAIITQVIAFFYYEKK